jgi:hypothetical protein
MIRRQCHKSIKIAKPPMVIHYWSIFEKTSGEFIQRGLELLEGGEGIDSSRVVQHGRKNADRESYRWG